MIRRATLLLATLAALTLLGGTAAAQTPSPTAAPTATTGTVAGRITSGTAGVTIPDGLIVRLIALDGSNVSTAAQTTTKNGAFELSAPATPGRTYVPHLVYEAIDYFGETVTFSAGGAKVQRDFLVYATTREAPQLTIASTVVTLVAIDRQAHQLGFVREDTIANPSDRVYVGDASGVTLHFPAPDGTIEAAGEGSPEAFTFERGVVSAALPIRPGTLTPVVTRYLVGYDAAADTYRLRVTSPLPAEQIKVRVPAGYARLRPAAGAVAAPEERLPGGAASDVLQVVRSKASTRPGGGILVDIVGLSGRLQSNPLTERGGAIAASALAVVIIGGGMLASLRWRAREAA